MSRVMSELHGWPGRFSQILSIRFGATGTRVWPAASRSESSCSQVEADNILGSTPTALSGVFSTIASHCGMVLVSCSPIWNFESLNALFDACEWYCMKQWCLDSYVRAVMNGAETKSFSRNPQNSWYMLKTHESLLQQGHIHVWAGYKYTRCQGWGHGDRQGKTTPVQINLLTPSYMDWVFC